jgi:hypothetical protein
LNILDTRIEASVSSSWNQGVIEEEVEEPTTSMKNQWTNGNDNGNDDDGDSSSTNDFLSEPEEEMNLRRPRFDDGGTSITKNNDGDTFNDGDTSDEGSDSYGSDDEEDQFSDDTFD